MGCKHSKKLNSKKKEISRFENDVSDDDIQQIIDSYPDSLMYTFSMDSDKFIYNVNSFGSTPSITKIPKKIMLVHANPIEDETCCICLDKIDNECVGINLCTHKFHQKCIEDSLNNCGESCPMCRATVDHERVLEYYKNKRELSISSYGSLN